MSLKYYHFDFRIVWPREKNAMEVSRDFTSSFWLNRRCKRNERLFNSNIVQINDMTWWKTEQNLASEQKEERLIDRMWRLCQTTLPWLCFASWLFYSSFLFVLCEEKKNRECCFRISFVFFSKPPQFFPFQPFFFFIVWTLYSSSIFLNHFYWFRSN